MQDPIAIEVSGYVLSLRKQEASTVIVTLLNDVVLNKTN
jgi:Fe2+ transport system protein FeoA